MDPIPMPAPYLGVNDKVPKIALQSPYAQKLHNFNVTQEGVSLRFGDIVEEAIPSPADANFYLEDLIPYGNTNLFALTYKNTVFQSHKVYDVETGALSDTATSIAYFGSLYFNKNLFLFYGNKIRVYNGATWSDATYTGPTSGTLAGGNVYKNRAYIMETMGTGVVTARYWYSNINAISGAMTVVDLATVLPTHATIYGIASFTLADNVATVVIQSFIFDSGDILFYTGSYPDSADWALAGTANVGSLLGRNSYFAYQGDNLLITETGVVSLRDLFLKGSEGAQSLSVNSNIQTEWKTLVKALRVFSSSPFGPIDILSASSTAIRGVWDQANGRLVISFPGYVDDAGDFQYGSFYFVFDTELKSWMTQRSYGGDSYSTALDRAARGLAYYKSKVYFATREVVNQKEGSAEFADIDKDGSTEVGYLYEIISAPVANGRAYVQRCTGLDAILETDLNEENNWLLIRDFGNETTTTQQVTVGTGLQKPFINIGIEGSYIQWWLIGTTTSGKTVGLDLYGINFWVEGGGSPR
ncbi:hypothetical protein UFOVP591_17 [uncultured Caudovirales phage]|uniref:Uncharacterized protein n=1 Tax=uncultured Caudovirales phage TaxID=2100421 RepID=A0A6J5MY50_9CAUD|nr:hypothetical protein UFOVP591_17 [uncultured Caudovirales phage]